MKHGIDIKELKFTYIEVPGASGLWGIVALHKYWVQPVGTVYYRWVGNRTIEIADSYVTEKLRRCGIRTAIHNELVRAYRKDVKRFITGGHTRYSKGWLEKMGFKRDPVTNDYTLDVEGET